MNFMDRQKTIKDLLLLMEDFGRIMTTKRFEQSFPGTLSNSQMDILMVIDFFGPQNTKQLAERLRITSSGVSQLVDFLFKDGFLTRTEDENDRRMIRLELTKKADHLLDKAKKMRMEHGQFLFSGLNDNELVQMEKIQRKMNKYLYTSKNGEKIKIIL